MIDCPICGREMPVTPRLGKHRWTAQQIWLVERMRALGASPKMCLRVLQGHDCSPRVINGLEHRRRRARKAVAA